MKRKNRILLSLALFLMMLLILGQQEYKKSQSLIRDLSAMEINDYVMISDDFGKISKKEATPLIVFLQEKIINNLLISKCQLGVNVFLTEISGTKIVLNCYGDAGIVQYELARGGKIITPSTQDEKNYFEKTAIPLFKLSCFDLWEIIIYFLKNILMILVFTLLPLFLSIKLFIIFISLLIILITIISTLDNTKKEKTSEKTAKEYFLKKIPPKLCPKTISCSNLFLLKEYIIPEKLTIKADNAMEIDFPEEVEKRTKKTINKIFHIPIFYFVFN